MTGDQCALISQNLVADNHSRRTYLLLHLNIHTGEKP